VAIPPFDPTFDDCNWTDTWTRIPIIQVTPGEYESFVVKSWQMTEADVCDQRIALSPPLQVRGLITADGTLWMSDVPQERLMMFNNAQASRGHILVGGLGLGLYPQYAMPNAESITIIEANPAIRVVVEPVVRIAADSHSVPLTIRTDDIRTALSETPTTCYNTIFLDTWDTIDAAHLPAINDLRNLAINHLSEDGHILLWGYGWMLRLFDDACRSLLEVEPSQRTSWLEDLTRERPDVQHLLRPIAEHFIGRIGADFDAALAWCRDYAIRTTGEA
jgi:hypothetical protein